MKFQLAFVTITLLLGLSLSCLPSKDCHVDPNNKKEFSNIIYLENNSTRIPTRYAFDLTKSELADIQKSVYGDFYIPSLRATLSFQFELLKCLAKSDYTPRRGHLLVNGAQWIPMSKPCEEPVDMVVMNEPLPKNPPMRGPQRSEQRPRPMRMNMHHQRKMLHNIVRKPRGIVSKMFNKMRFGATRNNKRAGHRIHMRNHHERRSNNNNKPREQHQHQNQNQHEHSHGPKKQEPKSIHDGFLSLLLPTPKGRPTGFQIIFKSEKKIQVSYDTPSYDIEARLNVLCSSSPQNYKNPNQPKMSLINHTINGRTFIITFAHYSEAGCAKEVPRKQNQGGHGCLGGLLFFPIFFISSGIFCCWTMCPFVLLLLAIVIAIKKIADVKKREKANQEMAKRATVTFLPQINVPQQQQLQQPQLQQQQLQQQKPVEQEQKKEDKKPMQQVGVAQVPVAPMPAPVVPQQNIELQPVMLPVNGGQQFAFYPQLPPMQPQMAFVYPQ